MRTEKTSAESLLPALRAVAPGTLIRDGIENILRAKTGGLLVVGGEKSVREIAEGGFEINTPVTATKLYELAKMDGAIILDEKVEMIWRANVQLVPQSDIPSDETGIRHRIAERTARQTGAMVLAISQRRSIITLFKDNFKYALPDTGVILIKANQAIQTLEKYRSVLEKALENLTVLEFEDVVTILDVVKVVQRVEMVKRIVSELDLYLAQLGTEGRLVNMQMEELIANVNEDGNMVLLDYACHEEKGLEQLNRLLRQLSGEELLELTMVSKVMGFGNSLVALDLPINPRGYRILNELPRLPFHIIKNMTQHFGSLQKVLAADMAALDQVDGIGEARAKAVKNGLMRLREKIFLERHS